MKSLYLILFIGLTQVSFGQSIISPDTVCVGTTVPFSLQGNQKFISYAWSFDGGDINPINQNAIPIPNTTTSGTVLSVTAQATMVYDTASNHYYGFVTSASAGYTNPSVQRLDFGINPNNTPSVVDLGNPNNHFIIATHANLEAIEIVLDDNGVFHAFINNRGIVHWVFGNGLNNPPTQTSRIYDNPSILVMAMQMAVIHEGGQWSIFIGQYYGVHNILRFDLGPNLNTIPVGLAPVLLPFSNANPSYFCIFKEDYNWFLFTSSIVSNSNLYKYSFGTNLLNNNPSIVDFGNQNPILNNNRGLNFLRNCDDFYMLGLEQSGMVRRYDFNGSLNNVPTTQSFNQLYGGSQFDGAQMIKPYWYNDTLWALTTDYGAMNTSTVYRRALMKLPSDAYSINYYSSSTNYVFNTPGIYDVVLYCDQADARGPQAFCKQIVVLGSQNINLGSDTALCEGDTIILGDPNIIGNFQWSTGDTTATILVHEPGTYWLYITGSACSNGAESDTINISFHPAAQVRIDQEDTIVCKGAQLTLNGSGTQSYRWTPSSQIQNPDQATININPLLSTTYLLFGKDQNGCSSQDSVRIFVRELPEVKITSDKTEVTCKEKSIQLQASGANSYLWSPGIYCDDSTISNPIISPTDPQTNFYVLGKDAFGCEGIDSIQIKSLSETIFFVPNAFSPNNDGVNDLFGPVVFCDFKLSFFSVFNRYGQLVYRSESPNEGWNGIYNGKKADVGVYFWFIEGKDKFGNRVNKKGDVVLLR